MGKRKGKGRTEGCLEREAVVVSSKGHTPDHRSRHKDICNSESLCSDRSFLRRDSQQTAVLCPVKMRFYCSMNYSQSRQVRIWRDETNV